MSVIDRTLMIRFHASSRVDFAGRTARVKWSRSAGPLRSVFSWILGRSDLVPYHMKLRMAFIAVAAVRTGQPVPYPGSASEIGAGTAENSRIAVEKAEFIRYAYAIGK
jgi:hypothetical protein